MGEGRAVSREWRSGGEGLRRRRPAGEGAGEAAGKLTLTLPLALPLGLAGAEEGVKEDEEEEARPEDRRGSADGEAAAAVAPAPRPLAVRPPALAGARSPRLAGRRRPGEIAGASGLDRVARGMGACVRGGAPKRAREGCNPRQNQPPAGTGAGDAGDCEPLGNNAMPGRAKIRRVGGFSGANELQMCARRPGVGGDARVQAVPERKSSASVQGAGARWLEPRCN